MRAHRSAFVATIVATFIVAAGASAPASAAPSASTHQAAVAKNFSRHATVVLSGSGVAGTVLKANPRSWGAKGITYRYRWYIGGSTTVNATSRSVALGADLAGQRIRVVVWGTKHGYRKTSESRAIDVGTPAVAGGETNLPGSVVLNPMQLQATEHFIWEPTVQTYYSNRVFSSNGSTIGRSAATSGAQSISVTYYLQTSQYGPWQNVNVTPPTFTGTFAGSTLTTGFWSTEPPQSIARTGWRFVYSVTWFDANGTRIGYADVYPTQPQDTVCQTTQRLCEPFVGYVFY